MDDFYNEQKTKEIINRSRKYSNYQNIVKKVKYPKLHRNSLLKNYQRQKSVKPKLKLTVQTRPHSQRTIYSKRRKNNRNSLSPSGYVIIPKKKKTQKRNFLRENILEVKSPSSPKSPRSPLSPRSPKTTSRRRNNLTIVTSPKNARRIIISPRNESSKRISKIIENSPMYGSSPRMKKIVEQTKIYSPRIKRIEPRLIDDARNRYHNVKSRYMNFVNQHKKLIDDMKSPRQETGVKVINKKLRRLSKKVKYVSRDYVEIKGEQVIAKIKIKNEMEEIKNRNSVTEEMVERKKLEIQKKLMKLQRDNLLKKKRKSKENEKEKLFLSKKQRLLFQEFVETERSYVENLGVLKEYYQDRLLPKISKVEYFNLFNYVEIIRNINSYFLERVEESTQGDFTSTISFEKFLDTFIEISPSFKLYESFISQFNTSLNAFERLESNKKIKRFLYQINKELQEKCKRMTNLPEYLISPIQRLPRYILLLDEMIKSTKKDSKLYYKIKKGGSIVSEITKYCDEKNKEYERFLKCKEYSSQFKLNDNPGRKFIVEGETDKYLSYLFTDIIVIVGKKLFGRKRKLFNLSDISIGIKEESISIISKENIKIDLEFRYKRNLKTFKDFFENNKS